MKKKKAGFTLIEMLVVIVVIGLLAGLMAFLIARVVDGANNKKVFGFVKTLEQACNVYKIEFQVFPPIDKPGSTALHHYLGRPRVAVTAWDNETGEPLATVPRKPIMEFKNFMLKYPNSRPYGSPCFLIDPWEHEIEYQQGGTRVPSGVEIYSWGSDEAKGTEDDVGNWMKDL